jgi:hypothetical protein
VSQEDLVAARPLPQVTVVLTVAQVDAAGHIVNETKKGLWLCTYY